VFFRLHHKHILDRAEKRDADPDQCNPMPAGLL
jgi:hypothetical protein